jgi:hypothetical protein
MKLPNRRRHHYIDRLNTRLRDGTLELAKPGQVMQITVRHDPWCSIWRGGRCNCNPEIGPNKPINGGAQ